MNCPGPLIWYSVGIDDEHGALLECARCDYLIVAGWFMRPDHGDTPILREGLTYL